MRYLKIIIITLGLFIQCKDNDEKILELREREIELREKEVERKLKNISEESSTIEQEMSAVASNYNDNLEEFTKDNLNDEIISSSNLEKDDINSPDTQKKYSPELLFSEWELNLINKGIFDYVTEEDCDNSNKMYSLYEKGKYPMTTDSKSIIPFEFNNDGIQDYLINYKLLNCVGGNGWTTDFIILTSENSKLTINNTLTDKLKNKYREYVARNYGSDSYVRYENGYLITKSFRINRINDNVFYGDFSLMQNGASCCPEVSGNFEYSYKNDYLSVYDIKNK